MQNGEDPILSQAVHYFIEAELLFMCLRCIELGDVLTQTAATFIVLKILMQEEGLRYCCGYSERFFAVTCVFSGMVDRMDDEPSVEILKNLIPCYLRMSAAPRACNALRRQLPPKLWNTHFINALHEDTVTTQKLHQLFYNVTAGHWTNPEPVWDVLQPPRPALPCPHP